MKTETKILGFILLLTILLIGGAVFLLERSSSSPKELTSTVVSIDYSKGQKIGSESAKVKLVEFSDFQCPACLAAEPVLKRLRSGYADVSSSFQLIYRHFPLTRHIHARKVAYLAEAAGEQGKFWEMHDKLFDTQAQWSSMNESDANAFFLSLAKDLGLSEEKVKEQITGSNFKAKIDEDVAEGARLGVNATPTFFLNGRKLNLKSFNDLVTVVDSESKK